MQVLFKPLLEIECQIVHYPRVKHMFYQIYFHCEFLLIRNLIKRNEVLMSNHLVTTMCK